MIDPTVILAELAAIQRDVRTVHDILLINGLSGTSAIAKVAVERIAALMSSIAAPPPAELAATKAALAEAVLMIDRSASDSWREDPAFVEQLAALKAKVQP